MARERTRVVRVDAAGRDMWWMPITRFAIRSFLASGGTTMRLSGDAVFTEEDVEHTWRFIVKKMPYVLRAL